MLYKVYVKLAALPPLALSNLPENFLHAAAALKLRRCFQCVGVLALALIGLSFAQAATPSIQCLDGTATDGIELTGSSRHCVAIQKFEHVSLDGNTRVLVVFVPGDRRSSVALPDDHGTAFNLSQRLKVSTIAIEHPAYRSDAASSEVAQYDGYTPANIAILANALAMLRTLSPGKKILLIGHSGGAAMAALLASRYPSSADAYLLAACPCDVPQWRQSRNASTGKAVSWAHSLSPQDEVQNIRADARIALVVGNRDEDPLAKFSEAYVTRLQRRGVKTRLTYAIGATHVSVLRSPEFFMLAQELADQLSR